MQQPSVISAVTTTLNFKLYHVHVQFPLLKISAPFVKGDIVNNFPKGGSFFGTAPSMGRQIQYSSLGPHVASTIWNFVPPSGVMPLRCGCPGRVVPVSMIAAKIDAFC